MARPELQSKGHKSNTCGIFKYRRVDYLHASFVMDSRRRTREYLEKAKVESELDLVKYILNKENSLALDNID